MRYTPPEDGPMEDDFTESESEDGTDESASESGDDSSFICSDTDVSYEDDSEESDPDE